MYSIKVLAKKIIRKILSFRQRVKMYWRFQALKLALSSTYNNTRDKNSETTANEFDCYLKTYSTQEIKEKMEKLKDGLDDYSQLELDRFLERQNHIYRHNLFDQKAFFSDEEWQEQKIGNKESIALSKKLRKYTFDHFTIESFYGLSGLRWLPENKKEKIKNGIFFDIGAFDGDSALCFHLNFFAKKVFAFEPETNNFDRLTHNAKILGDDIIEPIKKGVSDKSFEAKISGKGSMSKIDHDSGSQTIQITSIDEYVKEFNIEKVDVIKMDIEGEEQKAILGASNTIRTHKPTLTISIYHTPQDFFEIKPYLSELVPEYKYIVKKANPYSLNHELMLLAYV